MTLSLPKVVLCLAAAAILAVGCTTDNGRSDLAIEAGPGVSEVVAARAVNVALRDARFRDGDFLSDLASAEVRQDQRGLIVDVQLGAPRALGTWPLDDCLVSSGPVTGVRWLLDAEGREVLTVTSIQGEDSCF
ncbi:MAG: hypothetical protein O7A71_04745 [Chloroflexi bacterium]|nr:hypothetical protein [Chloroflexota bacterium]